MLCGALVTHLMARGVYVAGLLSLSLLKPLGSPGEGDLAPRSSWQGNRKAEGENFPLSLAVTEVTFQGREEIF